jgi:hypothetical protein
MKTVSIDLIAGEYKHLQLVGKSFELLATVGAIDVEFFQRGASFDTARSMEAGFYDKPEGGFDSLGFVSVTSQTIKIAYGLGTGGYNRTQGSVEIIGNLGAASQPQITLTNANQVLAAANAARRYIAVQNNDSAAVMRLTVDGTPATATRGFRILPGSLWEPHGVQPTGAINAMMETATAATFNCEISEI